MAPLPCNLCRSESPVYVCSKDGVDIIRCKTCGLIYVGTMREQDDLKNHYSEEYFEPYFKAEQLYLKKRFSKRLREIRQYVDAGMLLDVGCGAGFFLKLAADNGFRTKGVELSQYAADYARTTMGLDVFHGELADAQFEPEQFDVVTLWHVIEHVHDPKRFLQRINKLLKPGGFLALEVPNIGSIGARIAGMDWEMLAPREHFYYFTKATIIRLLRDAGFQMLQQRTFIWTTPDLLFTIKAANAKGFGKALYRGLSLVFKPLSFLRFRIAPAWFEGDVLIVYARKAED